MSLGVVQAVLEVVCEVDPFLHFGSAEDKDPAALNFRLSALHVVPVVLCEARLCRTCRLGFCGARDSGLRVLAQGLPSTYFEAGPGVKPQDPTTVAKLIPPFQSKPEVLA